VKTIKTKKAGTVHLGETFEEIAYIESLTSQGSNNYFKGSF